MDIKKGKSKHNTRNYYSTYPKIVALSFLLIIAAGTILLMLPISVKEGSVSFIDALFTATSATCVTGLIQFDTFTKWTLFGQLVILAMIQVGGLGFITLIMLLTRFVKKRVSVKQKILLRESIGSIYTGDLRSLGKTVIAGTAFFEILGAILLSIYFIPKMNFKNGLYTSVFLSVSAFCNAGFDVMGRIAPGSSLMTVNDNPLVILTISALIIIGGIGFIVWDDIKQHKFNLKKYSFHTKLTLITTLILLVSGTVLYLILESNNTLSGMSAGDKILNAFFSSVTARTAGFNSTPTGDMNGASKMLTYILMFIGGSSGSTAGGIKTTTVAILILSTFAVTRNRDSVNCLGKRITDDLIRKSISVFTINLILVLSASVIMYAVQPQFDYFDVLFECFSAMGTVGMSTGITSSLCLLSKIIITMLMFIGRVTSLIFVFTFRFDSNSKTTQKPKGNLLVG
ncbi:MAG: potassium transporter TrkG [Eubacteriales bacterium]|nr:potassium transporter TrkG [Eubacteriales bacterium]